MSGLEMLGRLNEIPLFEGLSERQLGWLRERFYARTYRAGVDVITAGSQGEIVYIILGGSVKVYMPQTDGTDVFLTLLGPGDPVGEMSLVDSEGRSASVVTLAETTLIWMNRADFRQALDSMPALANNLLRVFSRRLRHSTHHIQTLSSLDVIGRVAYELLEFAGQYGQTLPGGEIHIPLRLTQGDLSDMVGASRKRVNQAIVELKHSGCIAVGADYTITILDRKCLAGKAKR